MVPEVNFFLKSLDKMLSLFDALSPCETETKLILLRLFIYRLVTNS